MTTSALSSLSPMVSFTSTSLTPETMLIFDDEMFFTASFCRAQWGLLFEIWVSRVAGVFLQYCGERDARAKVNRKIFGLQNAYYDATSIAFKCLVC